MPERITAVNYLPHSRSTFSSGSKLPGWQAKNRKGVKNIELWKTLHDLLYIVHQGLRGHPRQWNVRPVCEKGLSHHYPHRCNSWPHSYCQSLPRIIRTLVSTAWYLDLDSLRIPRKLVVSVGISISRQSLTLPLISPIFWLSLTHAPCLLSGHTFVDKHW